MRQVVPDQFRDERALFVATLLAVLLEQFEQVLVKQDADSRVVGIHMRKSAQSCAILLRGGGACQLLAALDELPTTGLPEADAPRR